MLDWYTCAVFTPLFFWTATHFPVDRRHWRANLLVQLVASSIAVVIKYAFLVQVWRFMRGDANATLARALASNFIIESMIFWAVIAIIHGILFYRRWQEREQLAAELRVRLSEAQLEVLRGQLRPHFLFNTLNSISTLIHSDPASADRMVVQLADLLRASLETSGTHEIPLAEELALLERQLVHAVMMQFLLEAAFIALIGGVVGVLGGIFLTWLTAVGLTHAFGAWPMHFEAWAVTLGLMLSAMTGVASSARQTVAWRLTRVSVWATRGCVSVNSTATRMRSRSVVGTMAAPSSRSRFRCAVPRLDD